MRDPAISSPQSKRVLRTRRRSAGSEQMGPAVHRRINAVLAQAERLELAPFGRASHVHLDLEQDASGVGRVKQALAPTARA